MSSSRFVLPSDSWSSLTTKQLGQAAVRWRWLNEITQATFSSAFIPEESLTQHVVSCGLYSRVLETIRNANELDHAVLQARLLIHQTPLPSELQRELWQWLSHQKSSLVTITAAQHATATPVTHHHVGGEANLVESLLQTWASCITKETLAELKKSLNPAALTVQWWLRNIPTPTNSSGWLWTSHPWKPSSDWLVVGSWGDLPESHHILQPSDHAWRQIVQSSWPIMDQWWIDRRSREVTFHHKGTPTTLHFPTPDGWKQEKPNQTHQARACLSISQLNALLELAWKVKHKTTHHLALRWWATDRDVYLIDWAAAESDTQGEKSSRKKNDTVKLVGQVIQQGHVTGPVHWLTEKRNHKQIVSETKGKIVVASRLELGDAPMLIGASPKGIITQEPITHPSLLAHIKRYGIPTIAGVKNLKKTLPSSKKISNLTLKATQMGKLGLVTL